MFTYIKCVHTLSTNMVISVTVYDLYFFPRKTVLSVRMSPAECKAKDVPTVYFPQV
jgi:hypothetical protein